MDLNILNAAENPIPTHAYAAFLAVILGGIQPVKKFWQWVREGELVTWNASKGNKPSPTFALPGDDRIPEGVKLITK